ncbi:S8 family serine peptidase [Streptomyces sp. NPDC007808]|uniref:cyanobactin maturation protease PatG family protein n=1 Tax=Streptomyces sp. NPDC007808 TaxID=3364779 RepID=UPI0036839058
MDVRSILKGSPLQSALGRPEVCIAVIDGPVDLSHPCFGGASIQRLPTLVSEQAGRGLMSVHGTHVTSLLFGQPRTGLTGIAPYCRGLILPVFSDGAEGKVPQLDLARAIEQALEAGAHIINISGGERSDDGDIDSILERALRQCADRNVLVVAAVGNDGCDCLQVPASSPSVLAVGATDAQGRPLPSNDWGSAYRTNAVLAPGEGIAGASPERGRIALSGSSFATPAVSGLAALLVAQQLNEGASADPLAVGNAIVHTAKRPNCVPSDAPECRRNLAGHVNPMQAYEAVLRGAHPESGSAAARTGPLVTVQTLSPAVLPSSGRARLASVRPSVLTEETHAMDTNSPFSAENAAPSQTSDEPRPPQTATPDSPIQSTSELGHPSAPENPFPASADRSPHAAAAEPGNSSAPVSGRTSPLAATPPTTGLPVERPAVSDGVQPACGGGDATESCTCKSEALPTRQQYVYAIGTIGIDFGTDALRDSWRQAMPWPIKHDEITNVTTQMQPNIYDAAQLHAYLSKNPWDSDKLIWTLNLDGVTPLYALEAEAPAGMDWTETVLPTREYTSKQDVHQLSQNAVKDEEKLASLLENLSHPPVSRVYKILRDAYLGQSKPRDAKDFVSRVSIPGILTDRTVRLFSGQMVRVVEVKSRGLSTWNEALLVESVCEAVVEDYNKRRKTLTDDEKTHLRETIRALFDQVYYRFRNLGQTGPDRALNAAGTNAFLVAGEVADGILSAQHVPGSRENFYVLDTVSVQKSTYCRQGSECYDIKVRFFDPEDERRASVTYLFTYDVSTAYPVTLAPTHKFIERA